ncbi:SET domain-containing protein [Schizopora paradoxa]|uniref:SET domain-containing protein n=1 Tax=Schizopora paradoxa TaxID=27342 RepID=A0A0H2RRJ2_9AGAM|nr:SET domain-containing protein [Schizopora paradoxa]
MVLHPEDGSNSTSDSDETHRSTPTIDSSLISILQTPNAGFGVFAKRNLAPHTELLRSSSPAAYVIYRQFRKEVCAWCFRYDLGRTVGGPFNGGGMVFDTASCRDSWLEEYGAIGLECFGTVEAFVQKQSRKRGEEEESRERDSELPPSPKEIDQAWEAIQEASLNVRNHRLLSRQQNFSEHQTTPTSNHLQQASLRKIGASALANALSLPVPDADLLFFLLSGLLCRYKSRSTDKEMKQTSDQWSSMLSLCPSSTPYSSKRSLAETTHAYLQLLAILPVALLEDPQLVCRSTIESILSRDVGNSFGIWSVEEPFDRIYSCNDATNSSTPQSDDDPEMLGYAVYPSASFFNHSCRPNVHKQRIGRSWIFSIASDSVSAGDELSITYIRGEEDNLTLAQRRLRLEGGWSFVCQCSKCIAEEDAASGSR